MLGGIPRIRVEVLILMTSDHPVLMKMVVGITFVDGINHPLQKLIKRYLLTEKILRLLTIIHIPEEILVPLLGMVT